MDLQSQINDAILTITTLHSPLVVGVDDWVFTQPAIETTLNNLGYSVMRISQSPKDKNELLETVYQACQFPTYFGFNWDALKDCLADFHWQMAKGYILFFENPWKLDTSDLAVFLEAVRDAGMIWKHEGIVFKLLIPKGILSHP